jgi:hypothetical protein
MSNKYEVVVGFQSYSREITVMNVIARDAESAQKQALEHVHDNFGKIDENGKLQAVVDDSGTPVLEWDSSYLTKKPRFVVDAINDLGDSGEPDEDEPVAETVIPENEADAVVLADVDAPAEGGAAQADE